MKKSINKIKTALGIFLSIVLFFSPSAAFAAISFVGGCENSAASNPNGANVTLTLPAMQQNDLVIVAYSVGDNDNVNENMAMVTAGYTEVADLFADDTQEVDLGVYWKVMGASPDTSATVTGVGGTDAAVAAVCMVFRGVDTVTPMDVTPVGGTRNDSMNADPGPIDHNNPSGVWTVIVGASGYATASGRTYTFPTGYTTDAIDRESVDTSFTSVGIGYRSSGVSDPENPGIMTLSGTDNVFFSAATTTIALRPQAGSVPTVSSDAESNVSPISATLNGTVSADGGSSVTARGFAWGTNATLSGGNTSTTTNGTGTGSFSQLITNLVGGRYYYRAYATNSTGTGYGTIENLDTTADSTPSRKIRLFQNMKVYNGTFNVR